MWDPIAWAQLSTDEALRALFDRATTDVRVAAAWYERHKRSPQIWSRVIRATTIVFGACGGLAPVISGLRVNLMTPGIAGVVSQIGYLLIGIAAGLLAFDRYFGLSSAWLRYVLAITNLRRLESQFQLEWSELLLVSPTLSSKEDLVPFLKSASAFQLAVINLVADETNAWHHEFQSSAADLQKLVMSRQDHSQISETTTRRTPAIPKRSPGSTHPTGEDRGPLSGR
jgi:SMODS and SLOG-associating 2TM effector domain 2